MTRMLGLQDAYQVMSTHKTIVMALIVAAMFAFAFKGV